MEIGNKNMGIRESIYINDKSTINENENEIKFSCLRWFDDF